MFQVFMIRLPEISECDEYYPESNVDRKGLLVPGAKPSLAREFPHMVSVLRTCFLAEK